MSELKLDFDEVDGVIGKAKEFLTSSSTEVEIWFVRDDTEEVQIEGRTKEVQAEKVLAKEVQAEKVSDKDVLIEEVSAVNAMTSVEEIPAKGASSEEILTWSM